MRKYGLMIALLLASGCKTAEGPDPLVPSSVIVSASPTEIEVNETAQASAIVEDQNGDPLTGQDIVWSSLNESVATVTPAGVIRGVSPGNATIRGSVEGVTGSATVSILLPVPVCSVGVTSLDLAVGEARVIGSRASGGCVKVNSTGSTSSYVVITANLNQTPDLLRNLVLKSDEGDNVPAAVRAGDSFRSGANFSSSVNDIPGAVQTRFEAGLRLTERRELDFKAGRRAYETAVAEPPVRNTLAVAIPTVGDKTSFKVPAQFDAGGTYLGGSCTKFTSVTATVKFISSRAIIYLDDAAPAGGFSTADFQEIAGEFDNLIYPTDVAYFGTPLDQDANSRIIILYTPVVNRLTPKNQSGFVGGFFFVGDLFPATGAGSCPQSNKAEIFYALAPDPTGTINNNVRTTTSVRQGTRGTLAHEVQHMINASERFRNSLAEDFESTWLDEGLAHFAEDLNGRALKGLSETGNYTDAQLRTDFNDYVAFFFQNFARFRVYLADPAMMSPTSALADTSLAVRGAAWALVRYAADQYAPGGDIKAFTRALSAGPDTGVVNLTKRIGGVSFDSLAAGWLIANFADDAGIPNLSAKYTYKTYNMRDATRAATSAQNPLFPLQPAPISGTGFIVSNFTVKSASGEYFTFVRNAGAAARSFRLLNTNLTSAAGTGSSLILLRTQ